MGVGFFSVFGLGFLSASNNYTGNGVSFEYPADYKITEVKNNSVENSIFNATKLKISPATFLVGQNTKNPDLTFQISKSPVNGSVYHGMGLDAYYNTLLNDFKSRGWLIFSSNTTLYVDHTDNEVQAYEISYTEKLPSKADADSVNGRITMFDKNGIRYTIDFKGKGKQYYDSWASIKVATSFKVL